MSLLVCVCVSAGSWLWPATRCLSTSTVTCPSCVRTEACHTPTSPLKWWVYSRNEIKLDPQTHCSYHEVMNACEMSPTERATLELFEHFSARLWLDWYLGVLHIVIWGGKKWKFVCLCVFMFSSQSKYLYERGVSVLQELKKHVDGTLRFNNKGEKTSGTSTQQCFRVLTF